MTDSSRFDWPPTIPDLSELRETRPTLGGHAEIYCVTQLSMQRDVACKIPRPERLGGEVLHQPGQELSGAWSTASILMFMQEATITASLQTSRFVPTVYTQGNAPLKYVDSEKTEPVKDLCPYFVMEWISGPTLDVFVRGEDGQQGVPFCERDAGLQDQFLRIFADTARGLADAHSHSCRWVHRDLKPKNILLANRKDVKIIDWGIAQEEGSVNNSAGTPAYCAPEQREGAIVSPLFDIYALGRVGYFLLTGENPCICAPGDEESHYAALSTRLRNIEAPRFWVELIIRCLIPNPEAGRPSALEVVAAIDEYPRDQERATQRAKEEAQSADRRRERWKWLALVAMLVLVTVPFALFVLFQKWEEESEKKLAEQRAASESREKKLAQLGAERAQLNVRLNAAIVRWFFGGKEREQAKRDALETLKAAKALAERNPNDAPSQLLLSATYDTIGQMISDFTMSPRMALQLVDVLANYAGFSQVDAKTRQAREEELYYFGKSLEVLTSFDWDKAGPFDHAEDVPSYIARNYTARGFILLFLGRATEALEAYDQSLNVKSGLRPEELEKTRVIRGKALEVAINEQSHFSWTRQLRPSALCAVTLVGTQPENAFSSLVVATSTFPDHASAVRLSAYLATHQELSALGNSYRHPVVYNAACTHSLASADFVATEEERERRASQAVKYLNTIADEGYFLNPRKLGELESDPDLAPLRDRADFKAILDKIRSKKVPR